MPRPKIRDYLLRVFFHLPKDFLDIHAHFGLDLPAEQFVPQFEFQLQIGRFQVRIAFFRNSVASGQLFQKRHHPCVHFLEKSLARRFVFQQKFELLLAQGC